MTLAVIRAADYGGKGEEMQTALSRRAVVTMAALAPLGMPAIARAQSYKREYKISTTNTRPTAYVDATYQWAELVTKRTDGRINMKAYDSSQLVGGDATQEFPALRRGIFDFLVSSTINLNPTIKQMGLFSLPFLMNSSRDWQAIVDSGVRTDLEKTLLVRGAVPLAWSENGFRELCNSVRVIRLPRDLQGLKIRYAAGPLYREVFTALGANPVQMSWADLAPALATKAVDGMETPVEVFLSTKLYTLNQKFISMWNYSTDAMIYMANADAWKSFSKTDQEIIRSTADEVAKAATRTTRRINGGGGDRASFNKLAELGVTVSELTDAERGEFRQATAAVTAKWIPTVGEDLVKKAQLAMRSSS